MDAGPEPAANNAYEAAKQSPAVSSGSARGGAPAGVSVAAEPVPSGPPKPVSASEQTGEPKAAVPPTPMKPEPVGLPALKPDPAAAAQDGSSSNVPDGPHAMPAAVDGPQFFHCAYPMGMFHPGMTAPFTPQRLSALGPGFQTPMHVTLAPMAVVTFQAPLTMIPGGGVMPGGVMQQCVMAAHPAAVMAAQQQAAAAAANATAPVLVQPAPAAEAPAPAEVSPDVLARFEAALRAVMTQPYNDPAAAAAAAERGPDGAAAAPSTVPAGGTQWTQSSTGFKGVTKHKRTKRFEAHIWGHKQQVYLGSFDQGVQAARAHDIMALCNHGGVVYPGSHNALNFPPVLYSELLPFLGALSQSDVLAALRNFGKKTPAARRAAAAAAAAAATAPAPAPAARKRKAAPASPPHVPALTARQKRHQQQQQQQQSGFTEEEEPSEQGLSDEGLSEEEVEERVAARGGARQEGAGGRGEEDVDAEEAAALLHHFANGRLQ